MSAGKREKKEEAKWSIMMQCPSKLTPLPAKKKAHNVRGFARLECR